MQSVFPTICMVIIYILFVIFGQQWMKTKKAFELREFMFIYNFFQVIFCTYITYEVRQKKDKRLISKKNSIL
jgi:amino acid permease